MDKIDYDVLVSTYIMLSENHSQSQIQNTKLLKNANYKPLIAALEKAIKEKKLLQDLDLVKLWDVKMDNFIKTQFNNPNLISQDIEYYF
jgi:hypothetical protein